MLEKHKIWKVEFVGMWTVTQNGHAFILQKVFFIFKRRGRHTMRTTSQSNGCVKRELKMYEEVYGAKLKLEIKWTPSKDSSRTIAISVLNVERKVIMEVVVNLNKSGICTLNFRFIFYSFWQNFFLQYFDCKGCKFWWSYIGVTTVSRTIHHTLLVDRRGCHISIYHSSRSHW